MADVTIDAAGVVAQARATRSLVFTTPAIGYFFFVDGDDDFKYTKTSDGGASWDAPVTIYTGTVVAHDVWFDKWTPGDTGTKIHTWYIESGTDDVRYRALDTNGDSLGTETTVFAGGSAVAGVGVFVSGAKARGGNLLCAFDMDAGAETGTYRSTDAGASWGSRTNMVEATLDWVQMFPGGEADSQDMWALYFDKSATALTLKMHDDSANTNSESATILSVAGSGVDGTAQFPFSGSIRPTDNHLIVAAWTERDTATGDFRVFDINGTASITEKTALATDKDDCYHPSVYIDPSGNIYVAYQGKRDGSEALGTTTGIYYAKSVDGGTNWTAGDTAYSAGTGLWWQTWAPLNGPLFAVAWLENSLAMLTNATNAVPYVTGTAASTLPKLTSAAVAVMQPKAAAASTMPALTSAAVASQKQSSAAASTMPALTSAATATHAAVPTAVASSTVPALTSAAVAVMQPEAAAASTMPALTSAAVAAQEIIAAAASTMPALTSAGVATQKITAAAASTMPKLTSAAVAYQVTFSGFGRVRIEVYTPAGALAGGGPIISTLAFDYSQELDRIGTFSCVIPATDPRADLMDQGNELRFYREGEGLVFRGIIDHAETNVANDGQITLAVQGSSIARQLVWTPIIGRSFSGTTLASAMTTLLSGTGWSAGTLDVPATTLLQRVEVASVWAAVEDAAKRFTLHMREDVLNKEIDVSAFGTSCGIVLQNLEAISVNQRDNPLLVPIAGLKVAEESGDLWNSIVPIGAGEGVNKLTLQRSTRASPYTIQNAAGGDGVSFYYIEDATSVAAYGRRRKALSVKGIQPIANTLAGHVAAANALYDVANTELLRSKDPQTAYSVNVVGMKHLDSSGVPRFQVGDKFRLVYRGIVEASDGTARAWRSVDANLWLMGYKRSFHEDGSDTWELKVSTIDRQELDGDAQVAGAIEDLHSLKVSLRPFTYREIHGPSRRSVDATHTVTFIVDYDANVTYLHSAKLSVTVAAVRTNATGAASGGGSTSSAGSSHTHSVSGATSGSSSATSSAQDDLAGVGVYPASAWGTFVTDAAGTGASGASGTGATGGTNESTSHGHTENQEGTYTQSVTTAGNSVPHTHNGPSHTHTGPSHTHALTALEPGFTNILSVYGHVHDIPHNHSVSGQTAAAEAAHTHTVSAHTHTITYGIYEGSGPTASANVTVTINGVDRTVALGGSWDATFTDIDITAYLVDSDGLPLQQRNTIVFGAGELLDLEIVCRSIVTASALVPV